MCPYPPSAIRCEALSIASLKSLICTLQEQVKAFRVQILQISQQKQPLRWEFWSHVIHNSGEFCNGICTLTYNLCVERAIDKDSFSDFVKLGLCKKMAASCNKFIFYGFVNFFVNNNRLLRSTNHTIVKCFWVDDWIDCKNNIGCFVNNGRSVAGTYTECGFSWEYAALTIPGPPVARIISASFISVSVSSRDGISIQPIMPFGAPAFTAASRTTFAAAIVDF